MFYRAQMPYEPYAALHNSKRTQNRAQPKSISAKDQNVAEQRIRDIFMGITANTVIKGLIPDLKHN